jgi:hypothetical protein
MEPDWESFGPAGGGDPSGARRPAPSAKLRGFLAVKSVKTKTSLSRHPPLATRHTLRVCPGAWPPAATPGVT